MTTCPTRLRWPGRPGRRWWCTRSAPTWELPESRTIQPVYVEPVTIGLKSGIITQGDA